MISPRTIQTIAIALLLACFLASGVGRIRSAITPKPVNWLVCAEGAYVDPYHRIHFENGARLTFAPSAQLNIYTTLDNVDAINVTMKSLKRKQFGHKIHTPDIPITGPFERNINKDTIYFINEFTSSSPSILMVNAPGNCSPSWTRVAGV